MFNQAMLRKMLEMPDDRLLSVLQLFAGSVGMDPHSLRLDTRIVRKLRAVLAEITDDDLARMSVLAERFKNGG